MLAGLVSVIVPNLQSIAITLGLGPKNPLAITMESLHQIPDASSMGVDLTIQSSKEERPTKIKGYYSLGNDSEQ